MIVIRLTRVGKKNQPAYRVVLTEKSNPVKGKFIEILGSYNPRLKTRALKAERIQYWLSKGAQASPTVHNLLVSEKVISGAKVKAWQPKKKESSVVAKKAEEPTLAREEVEKTEEAPTEEPEVKEVKEGKAEEIEVNR